jgi:hypothetical protein
MRPPFAFDRSMYPCAALLLLSLGCSGPAQRKTSATALDAQADDGRDADAQQDAAPGEGEGVALDGGAEAAALEAGEAGAEATADAGPTATGFRESAGATWEGTGGFGVEVTLATAEATPRTFMLLTGGSAQPGSDYLLDNQLQVPANQRSARLNVMILDDREPEASETLTLRIADSTAQYTLSIADDDDTRWPTEDMVRAADAANAFPGANFSGLAYQPAQSGASAVLWMVRNSPPSLYRLVANGALWTSSGGAWSQGRTLVFPSGSGAPDAEDISFAEPTSPVLYAVSERDGLGASAPTILAYDTSASGTTLTATRAWNLSEDLRMLRLDPNLGPEALTWVPDSALLAAGFWDESTNQPYDPARYPNHGSGLFLIGIEQTGGIYAYALDHNSGAATRVASIDSGQKGLMALAFDRELNYLWAWCDDACGNHATILRVEDNPTSARKGRFLVRRRLTRPSTLDDVNNEGMIFAPQAECSEGKRAIFWLEDSSASHVLRRGTIPCGAFLGP